MDKLAWNKWIHSPRDYWKIGPFFIWKWLFLLLVGSASVVVLSVFGFPAIHKSKPVSNIPVYRYDDPKLKEQSGVVQILDDHNRVRYEGEVAAGTYTGQGKVYNQHGQLVYDGPVVDGVYQGEHAKVYVDGNLIYEGAMADNLYEGEGRYIDPDIGVISIGQFVAGTFEGEGCQYSREGVLLREGTFQNGLLHGNGMQYTSNGILEYEGEFRNGVFHGQGSLYHTTDGVLVYKGEFVYGKPTGQGQIYHPSGQLLYEGQVWDGQPKADAFLGLSLAEVEAAFKEHWLLYSDEGVTAFVYPYFHLMMITETPIKLDSPSQQEAETEQERQELLNAIANPSLERYSVSDGYEYGNGSVIGDRMLSKDTVQRDICITEVLSYGAPLAGVAQPDSEHTPNTRKMGWRERFSDVASGETGTGVVAMHTGPYVYEFITMDTESSPDIDYYLTSGLGVNITTVYSHQKDNPLWYQSAVRKDKNP